MTPKEKKEIIDFWNDEKKICKDAISNHAGNKNLSDEWERNLSAVKRLETAFYSRLNIKI